MTCLPWRRVVVAAPHLRDPLARVLCKVRLLPLRGRIAGFHVLKLALFAALTLPDPEVVALVALVERRRLRVGAARRVGRLRRHRAAHGGGWHEPKRLEPHLYP